MDRKTYLRNKYFSNVEKWTPADDEEFWMLTVYGENKESFSEFNTMFHELMSRDFLCIDDFTPKQLNYLDEIFTKLKKSK